MLNLLLESLPSAFRPENKLAMKARPRLCCEEPETSRKQVSMAAFKHFIHKSRFWVDLATTLYSANFCPTMVIFLVFGRTESLVLIWVPR